MRGKRLQWTARATVMAALLALVALPALGTSSSAAPNLLSLRASQGAAAKSYLVNPGLAPAGQQGSFVRAQRYAAAVKASVANGAKLPDLPPFGDRFNDDVFGLPQNEESVAVCNNDRSLVLQGTNDYRGILNDEFNFTGWHASTDGGGSLTAEGLLPSIDGLASSGDPAYAADPGCSFYAADLNFNVFDPATAGSNGIGVYRSTMDILPDPGLCDTSQEPFHSDPNCWPTRKLVATNDANHFLDKEWVAVGDTGDGEHVWVTWSDFDCTLNPACEPPFTAQIKASRCDMDLTSCTAPVLISGGDPDIQFSYPTIGPDGRTYVTWVQVIGELEGTPQRFILKMRVAEPGSTAFGPTRVVEDITRPLPFGGHLNANDFRIASVPKNTVKMVKGSPRVFVTWDVCSQRPFGDTCESPRVLLAYSDDFGATWKKKVISAGGGNYFPSVANDSSDGKVVVAYYTSRYDVGFQSLQDIELVTVDASTGNAVNRQRITGQGNNAQADWFFKDGGFIGDYLQVWAGGGVAYVGYNANIHNVKIFGVEGLPVPQQDNFLTVWSE